MMANLSLLEIMFVSPTLKYWMLKQENAVEKVDKAEMVGPPTVVTHSGKTQIITTAQA